MVTPEKLYQHTDCGLLILSLHLPGVEAAARENKPFRMRSGERTPSAWVRLYDTKAGKVWKVTDFGGEGRAVDPIQVHMEARGIGFVEAILDLAAIFNVPDELNRSVNRPDVRKQPATAEQPDGSVSWDIDQEFTDRECAVMGPAVRPDHLKALHWYRVNHIVTVKNREATYKYSNENYPIFMRECWFTDGSGKQDRFYKIYEPLNVDKQWRFQYQPRNKKPQRYTNGLFELRQQYTRYNEQEEKVWNSDPANADKPFKPVRLKEAVICSGERDALCCRALGYAPVWFNSETYKVSPSEFQELTKYVEKVYNIPDIDATGIEKGTALALEYIDIHTVWLPSRLAQYRDPRGNPRKDLRDWVEIWNGRGDFRRLLENAMPAKFWKVVTNEKTGSVKTEISSSLLFEFLRLNGFSNYRDTDSGRVTLVRATGCVVTEVSADQVRAFVRDWVFEHGCSLYLKDLVLTTTLLGDLSLRALPERTFDFNSCTPVTQFLFLKNFAAEVTPREIVRHDNRRGSLGRFVWEKKVIDHNVTLLPDMFRISLPESGNPEDVDIDVLDTSSKFFSYLVNSSRIYWRTELEENLEGKPAGEAEEYRRVHKFDIAGPGLAPEQVHEQKRCLVNKIFTIGYMMHRFKSPSRAWAPYAMDNLIGDNDRCNGRSGKSFMFIALTNFLDHVQLSGRNPKLLENNHLYERVSRNTDMILVDDCAEYLPVKQFYDSISNGIVVNPKGTTSYVIKYTEAPKFAFTTNYVPKEFDPSSRARTIYCVFSDYYHEQSEDTDYFETRKIRDDFGMDLMGVEYSDADWNADINFVMQCLRFYLSNATRNVKFEPDLRNIIFRKHLLDMSDNFRDWAEYYFAEGSDNLDREIVRSEAFEDFKRYTGLHKTTMQTFSRGLKGFCYTADHIDCLNPEELHTSGGRILRRITDENGVRKMCEMIYVRTKKAAAGDAPANPPRTEAATLFDRDPGLSDHCGPSGIDWDELLPPS